MSKLDNILKVLNNTLVKLDKLVTANDIKAGGNQESINKLMSMNKEIAEESRRAKKVQNKLYELVGE